MSILAKNRLTRPPCDCMRDNDTFARPRVSPLSLDDLKCKCQEDEIALEELQAKVRDVIRASNFEESMYRDDLLPLAVQIGTLEISLIISELRIETQFDE